MIRWALAAAVLLTIVLVPLSPRIEGLRIGSKKFTESVVLGECVRAMTVNLHPRVTHFRELGGTNLVFTALVNGEIDVYPEYTGTIREEILSGERVQSFDALRDHLRRIGIEMSEPLGFNNTYALAMSRSRAEAIGVTRLSDLARHPNVKFGFSNEFIDRNDGWPGLRKRYELGFAMASGMDHDIAYRQLELGAIDVIDVYSTDAKIKSHDLVLLEDDRSYFPRYDAVLLYRSDLLDRAPQFVASMLHLTGTIDEGTMTSLNARVEIERQTEAQVAADFVRNSFGITTKDQTETRPWRVYARTVEHLDLVRSSLIPAILVAVPIGILAAKLGWLDSVVLGAVGIVQTIPALALLVTLMPVMAYLGLTSVGLGSATAISALFLYSLLPIVRNTHVGLQTIPEKYREVALSLGVSPWYRLVYIEMPLAMPSIVAGIKTAAVINVGFATLGALIGAGGYGQPILTGIRLNDTGMVLEGAIPSALLALVVQLGFDVIERKWLSGPSPLRV